MHGYIFSSKNNIWYYFITCLYVVYNLSESNKINSWYSLVRQYLERMLATVRSLFFHTPFLLRLLIPYTFIFCHLFLKRYILLVTGYDLCSLVHTYWLRLRTTFIILVPRQEILPDEKQNVIHSSEGGLFILWRINLHLCLPNHHIIDV